jgi:hypothetical protein
MASRNVSDGHLIAGRQLSQMTIISTIERPNELPLSIISLF